MRRALMKYALSIDAPRLRRLCARRRLLALWIALVIGATGACAQSSSPAPIAEVERVIYQIADANASTLSDAFVPYAAPNGGYALNFPSQWLVTTDVEPDAIAGFDVLFVELIGGQIGTYAAVNATNATDDLDAFAANALSSVQQQAGLSDFQLLAERPVLVNGLPGVEHEMSYAVDRRALVQRAVILQHPDATFVLTLLTPVDALDSTGPLFDEIVRTFQVTR